ncbi:MAG TPA: hypothetical protein VMW75_15000 [Thermoanaerobaculia bacterium]|nr:hypothetical protein [Thermoanaerobaculia bacterium]
MTLRTVFRTFVTAALVGVGLLAAGCRKEQQADVSSSAPPPATSTPAAAAPATGNPAAPAAAAGGAPATPAAPAAPAAAAAPAGTAAPVGAAAAGGMADTTAKLAAVDWALKQDEIRHDPDGQWAADATASSSYSDATGDAAWSPKQATGEPNVDKYADDGHAWAPKTQDGGIEWLDLKYARPVHASEVRVRESMGSGAVIKVELFDGAGAAHTIWQGADPTTQLNYLILKFKPTEYKVDRVKVTLATNLVPGWNEIDAVQLVGKP